MSAILRIGTRDSQLAVWQATLVQNLLKQTGVDSQLVYMKSEGDLNTTTPLYALGVTGVFTKTLDAALLNNKIDIAVHSMKDVPVQLAQGIKQAAVLERASSKDILVYKNKKDLEQLGYQDGAWLSPSHTLEHQGKLEDKLLINHTTLIRSGPSPHTSQCTIATSSIRRIAQWKRRFPDHRIENLRGNVNTRLRKLSESTWTAAIFAAAGLERIGLRPQNSIDLDWMLPAPAQGAIMVVCRVDDIHAFESCHQLNHHDTDLCTHIERKFLSTLMGGCSTPISALAEVVNNEVRFKGNVVDPETYQMVETEFVSNKDSALDHVELAAGRLLNSGGNEIMEIIRKKGLKDNDNL